MENVQPTLPNLESFHFPIGNDVPCLINVWNESNSITDTIRANEVENEKSFHKESVEKETFNFFVRYGQV